MLALSIPAMAAPLRPDQQAFRDIYRELVETDTSLATGSCTLAAERMLTRLRTAGYAAGSTELFVPEGAPKQGGLIARLEGRDRSAKPMLLVDHIDVVDARAEDWGRDPYKLIEQDGYFVARGVIDDKALSAIWIDSLIRMKKEGLRPRRTIKVALTCGEESGEGVNGVDWLIRNRPEAVAAGFALNEGGYGIADAKGAPVALYLAVDEKRSVTFTLEARNRGGHSSRPRPDNAIYALSSALLRLQAAPFPITVTPVTRAYLERMSPIVGGGMGEAMAAMARNPADTLAARTVTSDVVYNAMLRTTCIPTVLNAGGAINALPQRALATIQCRLLPGDTPAQVEQKLRATIADPALTLSATGGAKERDLKSDPLPLDPAMLTTAEAVARTHFPGVPVVPNLLTAGTDGKYLRAIGIPTYGIPGILLDADGNGAHGVNERIRIDSVYRGRDYVYDLIRRYAEMR